MEETPTFVPNKRVAKADNVNPKGNTAVQILNRIARISWGSGGHSAGYVPLFVLGVGAENFNGKLDNTDIPRQIEALMKR